MVAIIGSSYGYPGTIDAQQWAEAQPGLGERYWVESSAAAKVIALGSAARTVRISAGRIAGHGVFDILTSSVDLELPNPASGTVYYTVVARRTWQTSNATTIEAVAGTSARAVAVARNTTPGVIDDQPLALVAVTKDQNDAIVSDDLRVVGTKGNYEASSEIVLSTAGYMDKPGYRIRIAGTEWLRTMAGTWEKIATPIEQATAFGSSVSGWSAGNTANQSTMVRDGRRRSMFLEQKRTGSTINTNPTGGLENVETFTIAESDRPMTLRVVACTYQNSNGDFGGTATIYPDSGLVRINALSPNQGIAGGKTASGLWSFRICDTWYTA